MMARFMGGNLHEPRIILEAVDDADRTWIEAAAEEIFQEHDKLDRSDPLYPRRLRPSLLSGYRFPPPPRPLRGRVVEHQGPLPDIITAHVGFGFSERVKDKVEELEPGVHRFFSLEITLADGSRADRPYWVFDTCNRLSALLVDQSEYMYEIWLAKDKFPDYSRFGEVGGGRPVLALDKGKIAGKAIWFDYKIECLFASDELVQFLDESGITGWEDSDSFTRRALITEVGCAD